MAYLLLASAAATSLGTAEDAVALSPLRVGATKDAFTDAARPAQNFGKRRVLKVDRRPRLRTYLSFDISRVPRPIGTATLSLFAQNAAPQGLTVKKVSSWWKERRITHRNAPSPLSTVAVEPQTVGGWVSIDLTEAARSAGDTLDLVILSKSGRTMRFDSRESGRGPRLKILPVEIEPPAIRVAVAGDIACDPADPDFNNGEGTATACRQADTAGLVTAGDYEAVFALGDMQYSDGALSKFLAVYDRTWGAFKNITYPIPGNHEYGVPGASGYFDYFGERAGEPAKGYYSFDLGNWHVVALNSNCTFVACFAGSVQEQWLRQDLAASDADCTVALWHDPHFSSGAHADPARTAPFWNALYEHGAELVLVGHEHFYERFAPLDANGLPALNGLVQITVGTSGKSLHNITQVAQHSLVRNNQTFGIIDLSLKEDGYDFTFVGVPGSSFVDSGSGTCH
jgi:hypothetical protein